MFHICRLGSRHKVEGFKYSRVDINLAQNVKRTPIYQTGMSYVLRHINVESTAQWLK